MIEEDNSQSRWERRPYRLIASVSGAGRTLSVCFENGDCVGLGIESLLPTPSAVADWANLACTPHDVTIPTSSGDVEISWLGIRTLTDPDFDAHLEARSVKADRFVGARIEELRRRRGISVGELAERAGLSRESVRRFEAGRERASFAVLDRILEALGASLDDLTANDDFSPAREPDPLSAPAAGQAT